MAFGALESAEAPRTTVEAPYVWPHGDAWKAKIFTREQPFLEGEAHERWLKDKQEYRDMKADGQV